jgi:PPOX class probable F420-dependent enzyme
VTPGQDQLWNLVTTHRHGVLATINPDGTPQLSNVLYVADAANRTIRISTTADRVKARNLARDNRTALHVAGSDFWHYAVAHGTGNPSPIAAIPGDQATDELFTLHTALYGTLERSVLDQEMITHRRLVLTLRVERLTGVITDSGRRPITPPQQP